ncbi:LysM peptidoglycan-binding domain-containing protein [Rickettsia endosymbiont of Halotydeus destructor]|uniref:LysM peptidoglycan-binding domain-containing protein n=1 Tax=Rickettsia endosymbiont of Halotydeus destructor TaxID=2996754 RepID=UPI003BB084D3
MPNREAKIYTVKSRDTLSGIATKNGLTVNQLLTIPNNEQFKSNPDKIYPGNKVKVSYTVKVGDTLSEIAQNYGTPIPDLVKYNNISNPDHIEVGWEVLFSGNSPDFS